jgi:gluconokinase
LFAPARDIAGPLANAKRRIFDLRNPAIVVAGVSGAGKSTIGSALAKRLAVPFVEGDGLHPQRNIDKMKSGTPLTDEDRAPWLEAVGQKLAMENKEGHGAVAACSALKRAYRDRLRAAAGMPLLFVLLESPPAVLATRVGNRPGHFMPASLLADQLASLELPAPDEQALVLPGAAPVEDVVDAVIAHLDREKL